MGVPDGATSLIAAARAGDKRATGRLISIVENDADGAKAILGSIYPDAHGSWITGITGSPGAGKSTLVNLLVGSWCGEGKRVAVLAVDPTSPFSGGALLGDRIRMEPRAGDVLFRSMATRGWLGGVARATERVATLCAGLGYDEILIETVGVGQSEVDVASAADTTVVVVTPAWGDGVQVAKAGVMEIGDVFVVNKADRTGVADTIRELREMLDLAAANGWVPPVVATVATAAQGLDSLAAALNDHRHSVAEGGRGAREAHRRARDFQRALLDAVEDSVGKALQLAEGRRIQDAVVSGSIDPWSAAAELIGRYAPE